MNLIGQTIHRAKSDGSTLNILTIPTHESQESGFTSCFPQHTWYGLYGKGLKTWNETFRKCPRNYHLLKDGKIPLELNFDVILSQNYADQYKILKPIADRFHIPLICVTHTQPYPQMTKSYLEQVKQLKGDFNVFITESSMKAWGWSKNEGIVIEHYIDTDVFKPHAIIERFPYILSVCNQFSRPVRHQPCGFPVWKQIIEGLPWLHLGADDPGFSEPAKNLDDLVEHYQKAQIFLNTSQISPIPMSLLEASSCEAAIVTTATCDIPNIFTHGHDCLMSNDPKELRQYLELLLKDQSLREKLGKNARLTILNRFTKDKFTYSWNQIFKKALTIQ